MTAGEPPGLVPGSGPPPEGATLHEGRPPGRFAGSREQHRPPAVPPGLEGLRGLYERYCDHQSRELLRLIPRDGLRAVCRAAREKGDGAGDPLARVLAHARSLLPLPPFESWMAAYLADRAPYLEVLGIRETPSRPEPVLVDVRSMGETWLAELHLFERDGRWGGFLRFTRGESDPGHRTADIFCGDDPAEARRRFRSFSVATLEAFLRSVLP